MGFEGRGVFIDTDKAKKSALENCYTTVRSLSPCIRSAANFKQANRQDYSKV
jgi:hypothetical protein